MYSETIHLHIINNVILENKILKILILRGIILKEGFIY